MLARAQRNVAHVARDRARAEAPGPKPGASQISGDFQTRPLLEGLPRRDYRAVDGRGADLSCAARRAQATDVVVEPLRVDGIELLPLGGTSSS